MPRHEEGRSDLMAVQQIQDARDADERSVGLVAHHTHPGRNRLVAPEHCGLGVHVEGERRGRYFPCGP